MTSLNKRMSSTALSECSLSWYVSAAKRCRWTEGFVQYTKSVKGMLKAYSNLPQADHPHHGLSLDNFRPVTWAYVYKNHHKRSPLDFIPISLIRRTRDCKSCALQMFRLTYSCSNILAPSFKTSIYLLLRELLWLPVHSRIIYKLACLTYNSLTTDQPSYTFVL